VNVKEIRKEAKRLNMEKEMESMLPAEKPQKSFKEATGSYLNKKGIRQRKKKRNMAKNSRRRNRK